MRNILSYRGIVGTKDCNELNHMSMTQYIDKFDKAGRRCFMELGLSRQEVVALEQKTNYYRETNAGDLIDIRSTLINVDDKTFTLLHRMYNEETQELVGKMKIVYANFDKRSKRAVSWGVAKRGELTDRIEH